MYMIESTHKMKHYHAGTHMDLVLFLDSVWIIMVWWWQIIAEACSQKVVKTYIYDRNTTDYYNYKKSVNSMLQMKL
jgi:hypothetical protein